jgi:hypothetical protein
VDSRPLHYLDPHTHLEILELVLLGGHLEEERGGRIGRVGEGRLALE